MKALYATRAVSHFHYHKGTVRELAARGHEITVLTDPAKVEGITDRALRLAEAELPRFSSGPLEVRRGASAYRADLTRDLATYAWYLRMPDQSPYYLDRWGRTFPRAIRWAIQSAPARAWLRRPGTAAALDRRAAQLPVHRPALRDLEARAPDVVVASPMNMTQCTEVEYVRAARKLGIPTVLVVLSWDNLTTKGRFHAMPDVFLVWNSTQREEAIRFHGIDPDRIVVTGSPVFDPWFELRQPTRTRAMLAAEAGLDPSRPFAVYLGSSKNIAPDERPVIRALADALQDAPPPVRGMQLLVRPHPANAAVYADLDLPHVRVWPKGGSLPDTGRELEAFSDSLHHAVATIGINTTGMIDAVIAGKPCLSILSPAHRRTQAEALHFKHLLDADVLDLADDPQACMPILARLMAGEDARKPRRAAFVQAFIRPHGLERPAAATAATAIEMAAKGLSGIEIQRHLTREADR